MEKIAALVAQKEQKIKELENKKVQKEQEKNDYEVKLEDLKSIIAENSLELDELLNKSALSTDEKHKLEKLITKHLAIILFFIIATGFSTPLLLIPLFIYSVYNIPKYIKLGRSISDYEKANLSKEISSLKNDIQELKKNRDQIINLLQRLDYALADIETEKRVTEDTLAFVLNSKSVLQNPVPDGNGIPTTRKRINPCI